MKKEKKHMVLKDIVHGKIRLEGIYQKLIECDDFQRLKDIVQTGTSGLQYKRLEEETRFEHSIGSYHLMCKMIENIEEKLNHYGMKVSSEEKEIAKIAMLLHDIGHGAYSHTLERITGRSHEQVSIDIIRDETTQIYQILKENYGMEFAEKVAQFLEKVYGEQEPKKIEIKNGKIQLSDLLASLISNNIDADRLDYIIRDSLYAGFGKLTEVDKIIDSFEFVLDKDQLIVAVPEEKMYLAETALYERARNYDKIYYCPLSIIGDQWFETLLKELRANPQEVGEEIDEVVRRFLTQEKVQFTNKEFMHLTNRTVDEAIRLIGKKTTNERIKYLCDRKKVIKDFMILKTSQKPSYIQYLIGKIIPELKSEKTTGVVDETRKIKIYKSNRTEKTNVITSRGVEDFGNLDHYIDMNPKKRRVVAINPELIRQELGMGKEEFREKHQPNIENVIEMITRPEDEVEARYVIPPQEGIYYEELKEKIGEKYQIVDEKRYFAEDSYYDIEGEFSFLESGETLRIRRGIAPDVKNRFKENRITFKQGKSQEDDQYITKTKKEEIGDSTNIEDYTEFLNSLGIEKEKLQKILNINNIRRILTIQVNGKLIDVSFNVSMFRNEIYETLGELSTIEIKPKYNQVEDRLNLVEIKDYIEKHFEKLKHLVSGSNLYELGVVETYEKYRKGYIVSEEAQEYEQENPDAIKRLQDVVEKLKKEKSFSHIKDILPVDEFIKKNSMQMEEEEEVRV